MSDPISELLFRLAGIPEDQPAAERPEEKTCPSLARFATGVRSPEWLSACCRLR